MSHSEVQPAIEKLLEGRAQFLNFLRNRMRHLEDAEELLQDAFLKTLEKSGELHNKEKIAAWFYRVLRNSVVDYYRKAGRNSQELTGILTDLEEHAKAVQSQNEICQCLHPLLEHMKPEYREALTTIDLESGSIRDLATRAGITEGNAAVRIHRARDAMRKQIQMACGACAEHHCIDCDCRRA